MPNGASTLVSAGTFPDPCRIVELPGAGPQAGSSPS